MNTIDDVRFKIKRGIVQALGLEVDPENIKDDAPLFGGSEDSLGIDSLAALEILIVISREFDLMVSEVDPQVFSTVNTLAKYVLEQLATENLGNKLADIIEAE